MTAEVSALRSPFSLPRRRILGAGFAFAAGAGAAEERVIAVRAEKWNFVPDQIEIAQGETVVFEFTAPEVIMGFAAADFGIRTDIPPGPPTRLRLTANKPPGRYLFSCDVFCGSGHEGMDGVIVVKPM